MFVTKLSDSRKGGTRERKGKKKDSLFQEMLDDAVGTREQLACDTRGYTRNGKMAEFLYSCREYHY